MITQSKKEKTSIKYAKFRRHLLDKFDHFDKQTLHELRDDISSLERAKIGLTAALIYRSILMNHESKRIVNPISKVGSKVFDISISRFSHNDAEMKQISRSIAYELLCEDFESINLVSKIANKEESTFVYKFELI